MSIEQNKQAVVDWVAALDRGDAKAVLDMTTEDFVFKCMSRQPEWLRIEWDREQFAAAPSSMSTFMAEPVRIWIVDMTAEGDKVAVEAGNTTLSVWL